jgi:hypothetical protein
MHQHGAFREAGRAARILQKSQIFLADGTDFSSADAPLASAARKLTARGRVHAGTIFLTYLTTKLTTVPLWKAEHVAQPSHHDVLDRRSRHDLLQRDGEILENDDHLGARILELMLQLAWRVQGLTFTTT